MQKYTNILNQINAFKYLTWQTKQIRINSSIFKEIDSKWLDLGIKTQIV